MTVRRKKRVLAAPGRIKRFIVLFPERAWKVMECHGSRRIVEKKNKMRKSIVLTFRLPQPINSRP
jgi:hypothetical protein